ncbi:MAG: hypothetical protein HMLKMBBP_00562 [Planctomycetes bacterium]|nr:hypothetical protein [Planctomycetota bacterium]
MPKAAIGRPVTSAIRSRSFWQPKLPLPWYVTRASWEKARRAAKTAPPPTRSAPANASAARWPV